MIQHTVIGLAGHIDHGKTALIRALTGIETDRLPEEKKRGITIDLGFAYWQEHITIIDVPGHEKFIKNMVAGVSTVNLFLLVIAADDGIMPQTREHLEILKFFGVQRGVVVITKTDLVDAEWLEMVQTDVRDFMDDMGFGSIEILSASAVAGRGIEELRERLLLMAVEQRDPADDKPFRLNVDRSFHSKGFGLVITGTVLSGILKTDQSVSVLPEDVAGRIRGLQVHQKSVQQVGRGQRAAINLTLPPKSTIQRGHVLTLPGSLAVCKMLWAKVHTTSLFGFKIKRLSKVRVHLGTSEVSATLNWKGSDTSLQQDKSYFILLKFVSQAVAAPGDAVLIRSLSPVTTLAGGTVLLTDPPKLSANEEKMEEFEAVLNGPDLLQKVKLVVNLGGPKSWTISEIAQRFFILPEQAESVLQKLVSRKHFSEVNKSDSKTYASRVVAEDFAAHLIRQLNQQYQQRQAITGFNFAEIQTLFHSTDSEFLRYVLNKLVNQKVLHFDGRVWAPPAAQASVALQNIKKRVAALYQKTAFNVPDARQLDTELKLSAGQSAVALRELLHDKQLVSIGAVFYLHCAIFDKLLDFLRGHFKNNKTIELAQIRDFTGSTRKYLIPLLEFLDREGYTIREGDVRSRGHLL